VPYGRNFRGAGVWPTKIMPIQYFCEPPYAWPDSQENCFKALKAH